MARLPRMVSWATAFALASTTPLAAADWPMYGQNLQRTFSADDPGPNAITPANAMLLQRRWFFPTTDAVTASPVVSDGVVYVGSWDGFFWALDAATGVPKWPQPFQVACDPAINPGTISCVGVANWDPVQKWPVNVGRVMDDGGIITSSAAIADVTLAGGGSEKRVFFGGGKTLYALDAATGTERWHQVICGNPDGLGRTTPYACAADDADRTRIFTSPAVFQDTVFVGVSPDGQDGYQGRVLAFDADSGTELWSFEVDEGTRAGPTGKPGYTGGLIHRGCGGVWSSIAIDEVNRYLYFGVADCDFGSDPPYNNRVVRLSLAGQNPLAFEPGGPGSLDTELDCDFDIGATPNLFELGGVPIVGVGRKDGKYYQWNRVTGNCIPSPTSAGHCLVLDSGVPGGVAGGFIGSPAADIGPGRTGKILGATAIGDTTGGCFSDPLLPVSLQDPSLHGMNADGTGGPDDAKPNWHRYLNQSFAGSAVANGVLYVGTLFMQDFRAFNAATGELLAIFPMGGQVNSAPAVVDGMVFVGSGSSFFPSPSGVNAFALPTALP